MSEPIEVPEYMLDAAEKAADEDLKRCGGMHVPVARLHAALTAALRAFTENPTVPSDAEITEAWRDNQRQREGYTVYPSTANMLERCLRNLFRPKTPPLPPSFASIAADMASDSRIGGTPADCDKFAEEWARKFLAASQEAK